jgi:hypothetical protein
VRLRPCRPLISDSFSKSRDELDIGTWIVSVESEVSGLNCWQERFTEKPKREK